MTPIIADHVDTPVEGLGQRVQQAKWTAPATNRLLLEAGFGTYRSRWGGNPMPGGNTENLIRVVERCLGGQTAPGTPCAHGIAGLTYRSGNWGSHINSSLTWNGSASYVVGAHSMKFGYQGGHMIDERKNFTNSEFLQYRLNNGVPDQLTMTINQFPITQRVRYASFYGQEQWTIGRMTLQGALRYDRAWSYSPGEGNGTTKTSRFNASPISFEKTLGVNAYNDITPRIGVAYDVFGNGRTALKFNFGHYLDAAVNDSIFDDNNPARRTVSVVTNRSWADNDRDFVVDCDQNNFGAQSPATTGSVDTCGALTDQSLNFGRTNEGLERVDPDLLSGWGVRQNDWQFGINLQQQILPRVSLDVGYNRRWWAGPATTDNIITDDEADVPLVVAELELPIERAHVASLAVDAARAAPPPAEAAHAPRRDQAREQSRRAGTPHERPGEEGPQKYPAAGPLQHRPVRAAGGHGRHRPAQPAGQRRAVEPRLPRLGHRQARRARRAVPGEGGRPDPQDRPRDERPAVRAEGGSHSRQHLRRARRPASRSTVRWCPPRVWSGSCRPAGTPTQTSTSRCSPTDLVTRPTRSSAASTSSTA